MTYDIPWRGSEESYGRNGKVNLSSVWSLLGIYDKLVKLR